MAESKMNIKTRFSNLYLALCKCDQVMMLETIAQKQETNYFHLGQRQDTQIDNGSSEAPAVLILFNHKML